jgi:hypothetical protein
MPRPEPAPGNEAEKLKVATKMKPQRIEIFSCFFRCGSHFVAIIEAVFFRCRSHFVEIFEAVFFRYGSHFVAVF